MKKSVIVSCFCILFTGFLFISIHAQQAAPFSLAVFEEVVAPADMAAFNKAQQQAVDLWKKHSFDMPIYCYATDDNIFYWVIPIRNFGSIDTLFKKSAAFMKKANELDGFDGSAFRDLSTSRSSVITWVPELSYKLDGGGGQSPDKMYLEWSFFSIKSGHEKEVADVAKKYIEFYKRVGEKYEWDVYNVSFGYDMPMMIMITRSENPVAIRQKEAELWQKYGKELGELWNEFAGHLRKVEHKTGWFRPNWSINTMR